MVQNNDIYSMCACKVLNICVIVMAFLIHWMFYNITKLAKLK